MQYQLHSGLRNWKCCMESRKEMLMEKERAQKIVDDISNSVNALRQYSEYICDCKAKEIHMSQCIRRIAEAMGLDVNEKPWQCGNAVATEISFVYEGVRFFELENYRKCDKDDGTDRKQNGS